MSSKPTLRLDWCSHAAAKYAVEHWHYSRKLISTYTRPVYLGVWEGNRFSGAIVFSHGVNKNIGSPYGLHNFSCVELVRVALAPWHVWEVSKAVAVAIRMLKAHSPGLRLLVSYADHGENHHGGIYQAGGWVYVGTVDGARQYTVNGRKMHNRAVDCSGLKEHAVLVSGSRKHKYLYPLDDAMREQIAPLAKPYPKRAGSIAADATTFHAGEGGSIPTPALHKAAD